jgi:class 3 adenylate cyclase
VGCTRNERATLWARGWGREAAREDYEYAAPSLATDEQQVELWARYLSLSASPGSAIAVLGQWRDTDISAILPTIRVPTLVLIREEAPRDLPKVATWLAATIPGAQLSVVPGRDLALWAGDVNALADEIEAFVTGVRPSLMPQTVLATVLFTDIVGSTARQAALGDRAWRELLQEHHALVREQLGSHRGVEVDTAGDGFYATFDGPARAVRCALDISRAVRALGLEIRAGLHTGECELIDGKAGGLAVSIGARVAANAGPSQVLVSQTLKDLVAGAGLVFEDTGERELKGVPGRWRLFAVVGD